MVAVHSSLHNMGVEQYLLAFLFLASYAFALSEFMGRRGRLYAMLFAAAAAIGFAARTEPWEHGVLVVAFALVAMGLFAGTAWVLWALAERSRQVPPEAGAAPLPAQSRDGHLPLRPAALAVPRRPGELAPAGDPRS